MLRLPLFSSGWLFTSESLVTVFWFSGLGGFENRVPRVITKARFTNVKIAIVFEVKIFVFISFKFCGCLFSSFEIFGLVFEGFQVLIVFRFFFKPSSLKFLDLKKFLVRAKALKRKTKKKEKNQKKKEKKEKNILTKEDIFVRRYPISISLISYI